MTRTSFADGPNLRPLLGLEIFPCLPGIEDESAAIPCWGQVPFALLRWLTGPWMHQGTGGPRSRQANHSVEERGHFRCCAQRSFRSSPEISSRSGAPGEPPIIHDSPTDYLVVEVLEIAMIASWFACCHEWVTRATYELRAPGVVAVRSGR